MTGRRDFLKGTLWKRAGEIAQKVDGHGGMDFLMDLKKMGLDSSGVQKDESALNV